MAVSRAARRASTAVSFLLVSLAPHDRSVRPGETSLAYAVSRVEWRRSDAGLETAELRVHVPGEAKVAALGRMRIELVRVDPARFAWALDRGEDGGAWRIDAAPANAALAFNAGQFTDAGPWGWVVHRGREFQAPAHGPLSAALVIASDGRADIVDAASLDTARAAVARGAIREAMQSYPAVLRGHGEIPDALRRSNSGVDLEHRDARLAVGILADGHLVVALTRFDAPAMMERVPFGLTVPEMATLMRALGCKRAVLLDGGLSAQLAVRMNGSETRSWAGLRGVPLGLVARSR